MIGRHVTFVGSYGIIYPSPSAKKRKRFVANFDDGMNLQVKRFPTRRAAVNWLSQIKKSLK